MHVSIFIRQLNFTKPILLEVITWKLLQLIPILCLLVVIDTNPLQAVIIDMILVHPLYQLFQFLSSIQSLIEVYEQSQAVLKGVVVSIDSVEDEQCVLKLSSMVQDIRPFQQDLTEDTAFIMLDFLGEAIGSCQRVQSIIFLTLPQRFIRLVEIVINLVIQLSVCHSLYLRSGEVQYIDLEDQLAVGRNQGDSLLHSICVQW